VNNTGQYNWSIPKDTPTGKGYQFRITLGEEQILSNSFKIKGKYPMVLFMAPVPVLAVGGYFIYKLVADKDLPGPPENGHPN